MFVATVALFMRRTGRVDSITGEQLDNPGVSHGGSSGGGVGLWGVVGDCVEGMCTVITPEGGARRTRAFDFSRVQKGCDDYR